MKKTLIMIITLFWMVTVLPSEKLAVLPEILKPDSLALDHESIYVVQEAEILVYNLKDFKLKLLFGKKGEGPAEFIPPVQVFPRKDSLLITSRNKLSWFSRKGEFLKTERPANFYDICPLKNGFAARGSAIDNDLHFITVNIVDRKFNIIKELARMQSLGQRGDKISPIRGKLIHKTDGAILVLCRSGEFHIQVFDSLGNLLHEIRENQDRVRVKFTSADEQVVRHTFEIRNPAFYAGIKNRLAFPDVFPPIRDLYVSGGNIYVMTFRKEKENTEFRAYTLDGKLIKSAFLPVRFRDFFTPEPFDFYGNDLYLLVENEEEVWEVHKVQVL